MLTSLLHFLSKCDFFYIHMDFVLLYSFME